MHRTKKASLRLIAKLPQPLLVGIIRSFDRIAKKAHSLSWRLNLNTLQIPEVREWHAVRGDETLRIDYPLNEQSIVFDVGGFVGEWSAAIFLKYMPTIHVFEPVADAMKTLTQKFTHNPKVHLHQVGLAGKSRSAQISHESHGASLHTGNMKNGFETIELVSMKDFLDKEKISHIDLIKINIEGGEYELLEHIIETGIVSKITDIQVQFHTFVPDAPGRRQKIRESLAKTHTLTYNYDFVWENWRKNK